MKRNIVLLYVYYHQGCEMKDIIRDIDMNTSTIGTSLDGGLKNGELTFAGFRPRQYYCTNVDATSAEVNQYVFAIIKRYKFLTREKLCTISGLSMHTINRELTRLKNIGKVMTSTGLGVHLVEDTPAPVSRYQTLSPFQRTLSEVNRRIGK